MPPKEEIEFLKGAQVQGKAARLPLLLPRTTKSYATNSFHAGSQVKRVAIG